MRIIDHPTPRALLAHAGEMLEARESENALILGLLASPPTSTSDRPTWISVDAPAGPRAVAMRTPPFNVLLSRASDAAMEALVTALIARGSELPGVTGPTATARAFSDRWAAARGVTATVTMQQGLYELVSVVPPSPLATGTLRPARADETGVVASWMAGFGGDARLPVHERESLQRSAAARIAGGGLFMWDDDGAAVSMASLQGATRNGIRVSFVYTPPAQRRRGYASACVAALSAHALASGRRFCTLYTDLANPTSNAIYQRVGYRRVGESTMIAFAPRPLLRPLLTSRSASRRRPFRRE